MTNKEAVERFDQAQGAKIEKMFWIAGSLESGELNDLIEEMEDESFKKCFPEIANSEYFQEYKNDGDLFQALIDNEKFGILAEIYIPIATDFNYTDGKVSSWSLRGGCYVHYVYAETLNSLLKKIEKLAENQFQEFLKKDKNSCTK